MKKNKLIIFIALLITASMSGLCAVHADITQEPQIDANNILTLSGKTAERNTPVTLEIYESGKNITNIASGDISDMFYYIREVVSGSSGDYVFEVPLKGIEKQFKVRVKEGKSGIIDRTIDFKNNMAGTALNELKSADSLGEVKTSVNDFLSAVEFSFELYNDNKSDIENSDLLYKVIDSVKNTEVNSQSDLMELAEYAAVLYSLANADDTDEFKDIFDKYSKHIFAYDSQLGSLYNNKTCVGDSVKADIIQRLYSKKSDSSVYGDKKQFRYLLQESIILSCCEKNRGYEVFEDIADVLAEIYKTDSDFISSYTKYKTLSQSKKNEAALEIIGHSFINTKAVISKIREVVADAGNTSGGGSSSGSSSGGGGGGSGSSGFRAVNADKAAVGNGTGSTANTVITVNIPQKTDTVVEFVDLDDVQWAQESIQDLASREIIAGKGDNIFAPNDYVTREEFIKMLVSSLGISVGNDKCSFDDIAEDTWYYKYVAAGYANGIINGIDNSNFGQGRFVSRQDIAAMVGRAVKKAGFNITAQDNTAFADDSEIADYAKTIIYSLKTAGIINGKENNMFVPTGSTTRAEAAKIISSMIGYIEKSAQ